MINFRHNHMPALDGRPIRGCPVCERARFESVKGVQIQINGPRAFAAIYVKSKNGDRKIFGWWVTIFTGTKKSVRRRVIQSIKARNNDP